MNRFALQLTSIAFAAVALAGCATQLLGVPQRVIDSCNSLGTGVPPAQAIASCTRAIETPGGLDRRNAAGALVNRGVGHRLKGETALALADFTAAMELDPGSAPAYIDRASMYQHLGQFEKSLTDYDRAAELRPNNPRAGTGRAITFALMGQRDHAVAELRANMARFPGGGVFGACVVLGVMGASPAEGMANCDRAVALAGSEAFGALEGRSALHLLRKEYAAAAADADASLRSVPGYPPALYFRGLAKRHLGDAGGDADVLAAEAAEPGIRDYAARYGIRP